MCGGFSGIYLSRKQLKMKHELQVNSLIEEDNQKRWRGFQLQVKPRHSTSQRRLRSALAFFIHKCALVLHVFHLQRAEKRSQAALSLCKHSALWLLEKYGEDVQCGIN